MKENKGLFGLVWFGSVLVCVEGRNVKEERFAEYDALWREGGGKVRERRGVGDYGDRVAQSFLPYQRKSVALLAWMSHVLSLSSFIEMPQNSHCIRCHCHTSSLLRFVSSLKGV
ncbi:unnamed protein product [Sphenostylis stenocarpa]|uniref:Secreted protein n=1 Tax=Sphenostylis stenocarpa TaxID=92480 RepID=A0AA86STI7_9FABA|nr:unnamed protein product [Sphenostylis stenocarpa]